jgi:hypothetical protein
VVHHGEDAGLHGALGCRLIDDALLQPQRWQLQADAFIDDPGHELRFAEHVDDVDTLAGLEHLGQIAKACRRGLPKNGRLRPGDRDCAVAESLQRARHAVAGTRGIGRQADHGDYLGGTQQLLDLFLGRVHEHGGSLAFACVGV